ncbi:MAG: aldehyde ferredoxin oxidoreductase N-terminal domain-containing protein, partial [Flavobacteriaceae bacterium]|nr:aldehyde ferredoxin oxidoreductase N-terminal domain-containing protein [Flavobacteriaceae bacterium]
LDARNKLIFATGPLTGTGAPGSSRYMVVTKGPLTGAIAHSSAGGAFASAINHDNVFGIQFHPEKSHQNGITLLHNFAKL